MKQPPSSNDNILYIVFGLIFLLALFAGLSFHPAVFDYVRDYHPGVFDVYRRGLIVMRPAYHHWYIVLFAYVFSCFVMAWMTASNKINFRQYRKYVFPAMIATIFLLFAAYFSLLRIPELPFRITGSLYVFALAVCPVTIMLYKRSHDSPVMVPQGDMHKRLLQNKAFNKGLYTLYWKTNAGYVLVRNAFRGAMIVGGPGAGKSFTLIEPIIDQTLHYGFAGLIYDFKFPTLALYAYHAYFDAKEKGQTVCDFYTIYFKDPRFSHRCNPIHPKILTEYAFANESSKTILYNINLNWAQKSGEFFSDSAVTILSGVIWYLRCRAIETKMNICTLAHVIEFCAYEDFDRTIEVMLDNEEVSANISALRSAQRTGAGEQLGGQLASLQIAMAKLNDKKMAWVTSGDDFTLDINVPVDTEKGVRPRIVILGNDDILKKSYAPALSLFASNCAGLINQKGRIPCAYIVDEAPTLVVQNLENLPNTGRSNKIFCCIAMQDFSQMTLNYGDKAGKVLRAGFGNIFIGETSDEDTARFASNLVGKGSQFRHTVSDNQHSSNLSYNEQYDVLIHPHEIMRLNTGEFVGKVTDAPRRKKFNPFVDNHEDAKVFAAAFQVEKPAAYYQDSKKSKFKHSMPLTDHFRQYGDPDNPEHNRQIEAILLENVRRIRKEVNALISSDFWNVKIKKYMKNSPHTHIREHFHLLQRTGNFSTFCAPYVNIAEQIYGVITNNTATTDKKSGAANPNSFVLAKIIERIEKDLQPPAIILD